MRTTINIDDKTAKAVLRFTRAKTAAGGVSQAIEDWVRSREMEELIALRGTIQWHGDLDAFRALEAHDRRGGYGRKRRAR